jgi:hypothetical protein
MGTFRQMAGVAADAVVDLAVVRNASPVVHAILALILLIAATVLGVYKPFGMTAYGRRKQDEQRDALALSAGVPEIARPAMHANSIPQWMYLAAVAAIGIMLLVVLLHLSGSAFRH